MGTCVQLANQQQFEFNTIDQIRLYENRHVYMNPEEELQWKRQNNGEESMLKKQLEAEELQKQQQIENQKIHQQMINLYDSSNEASNLQADLELRSLNLQPSINMQQRSVGISEAEKKQDRSFTQGQSPKVKKNNAIQEQEKQKQLIDYLSKGEKDILLQPLPSLPNLFENIDFGVYQAFDSAEITPLATPQQEEESECEELEEEPLQLEQEIVEVEKKQQSEQEIVEVEKKEVPQPEQKSFQIEQPKSQVVLDNPIFQQNHEDTISLEDDNPDPEEVKQNAPPQERQIILQSSRGEQMIMSFAPNQQQQFIKSQQQAIPENEVEVLNHKPSLEKAVPSNTDVLKIENEHVVALSAQLEPININVDIKNCEMLGPYIILDTGDVYVGTWQMGKRHGFGKQIFSNGAYYEGQWLNDFLQGYGRYIFQNGDYYAGEFVHGEREGVGVLVYQDGSSYEGKWLKNQKNGEGREQTGDGNVYVGTFKAGKKDGKGRLEYVDGSIFEGVFKEGQICGKGTQTWPDGRRYEGEWKDGKMHGQGEFIWGEGKSYKGEYINNVRQGYGEYSWPDGRTYKGGWKNGIMHGKGLMIWPDQRLQKGIWINGQKQFSKEELAQLSKVKKSNTADTSINKTKDSGAEGKETKEKKKKKSKSKSKSKEKKKKTKSKEKQ
ncbi:unnamed protein product [Paramecium sonneborni]|uniref:MORN repeat protein n=1 Tax=Paramecium sonneborni TaxID=65129 RepID=A0A8S1NHA8_9CILI|nr:unnamed protein product [Paramecium sonneborni]